MIEEKLAKDIRVDRDGLLSEVDRINPIWWETFSEEKKQEWKEYRQSLLNVPQQEGFPWNVTWPTKPE